MTHIAVTVLGHDRPGIIAATAAALASCGMNLEDSSMTLLRGNFAMTLICSGDAPMMDLRRALATLADESLTVDVRAVPAAEEAAPLGDLYLITVHGADRLGIVARLAGVVAEAGGNITDLTTRLAGDLYVLLAEVDLAPDTDVSELEASVRTVAGELGVDVSLRAVERDQL